MNEFITRASHGFQIATRAIKFVMQTPSTWPLIIIPVLINTILTFIAFIASLTLAISLMHGSVGDLFGETWLQWTFYVLTYIGMMMLVLVLTLMTWLLASATIGAIFEEMLAKKTMALLNIERANDPTPFYIYIGQSIVFIVGLLIVNIILLFLNLIPLVGSVLALVIGGYINAWAVSWQYSDMALGMRGLKFKEKIEYGKAHHAEYIGLGLPGILIAFIPLIGPIILAITVISAVMMAEEMIKKNSRHPAMEKDSSSLTEATGAITS